MTNKYTFYQKNIGTYKREIANLIYKRMVSDGMIIPDRTTESQFIAIANILYAQSYHVLHNIPKSQQAQYINPKTNPRGLFTLSHLNSLLHKKSGYISEQFRTGKPTFRLYIAKNMLLLSRRAESSFSKRITIFKKSIDLIDAYDNILERTASKVGTASHWIYNRIIYDILEYYDIPGRKVEDKLSSGKVPDIQFDISREFLDRIYIPYIKRTKGKIDTLYEIEIPVRAKKGYIDVTMARSHYSKKKISKYHTKDTYLGIILYGPASIKSKIKRLNEEIIDELGSSLWPGGVQYSSIQHLLEFFGMDSSLYSTQKLNSDKKLKNIIDNSNALLAKVEGLLKGDITAFNNKGKYHSLRELSDECRVYLESKKANNYLGTPP